MLFNERKWYTTTQNKTIQIDDNEFPAIIMDSFDLKKVSLKVKIVLVSIYAEALEKAFDVLITAIIFFLSTWKMSAIRANDRKESEMTDENFSFVVVQCK